MNRRWTVRDCVICHRTHVGLTSFTDEGVEKVTCPSIDYPFAIREQAHRTILMRDYPTGLKEIKVAVNTRNIYESVCDSIKMIELWGHTDPDEYKFIELTVLETPEEGCYFGFWDGEIRNVFPSKLQVQVCSPDFYQGAMEHGQGWIVYLSITEVDRPASFRL